MLGSSKTPPKHRLHKRSGQAIVTLSGHDHYLGPHGSKESQHRYDALIQKWLPGGRNEHVPKNVLNVDVEDTKTYIAFATNWESSVPIWIYIRGFGILAGTRYSTRLSDEPWGKTNQEAIDVVTRCLEGWGE